MPNFFRIHAPGRSSQIRYNQRPFRNHGDRLTGDDGGFQAKIHFRSQVNADHDTGYADLIIPNDFGNHVVSAGRNQQNGVIAVLVGRGAHRRALDDHVGPRQWAAILRIDDATGNFSRGPGLNNWYQGQAKSHGETDERCGHLESSSQIHIAHSVFKFNRCQ
jgi:hypothetical protein